MKTFFGTFCIYFTQPSKAFQCLSSLKIPPFLQLSVPKEKKMRNKRRRRRHSEQTSTSFGDDHPSDLYDPSSRDSNEASSHRPLNSELINGETEDERNEKSNFFLYEKL